MTQSLPAQSSVTWRIGPAQRLIGVALAALAGYLLLTAVVAFFGDANVGGDLFVLGMAALVGLVARQILDSWVRFEPTGIVYRFAFRTRRFDREDITDLVIGRPGHTGVQFLMQTLVVERRSGRDVPLRVLSSYSGTARARMLPERCAQARTVLSLPVPEPDRSDTDGD